MSVSVLLGNCSEDYYDYFKRTSETDSDSDSDHIFDCMAAWVMLPEWLPLQGHVATMEIHLESIMLCCQGRQGGSSHITCAMNLKQHGIGTVDCKKMQFVNLSPSPGTPSQRSTEHHTRPPWCFSMIRSRAATSEGPIPALLLHKHPSHSRWPLHNTAAQRIVWYPWTWTSKTEFEWVQVQFKIHDMDYWLDQTCLWCTLRSGKGTGSIFLWSQPGPTWSLSHSLASWRAVTFIISAS